jgi:hypothetical protein
MGGHCFISYQINGFRTELAFFFRKIFFTFFLEQSFSTFSFKRKSKRKLSREKVEKDFSKKKAREKFALKNSNLQPCYAEPQSNPLQRRGRRRSSKCIREKTIVSGEFETQDFRIKD